MVGVFGGFPPPAALYRLPLLWATAGSPESKGFAATPAASQIELPARRPGPRMGSVQCTRSRSSSAASGRSSINKKLARALAKLAEGKLVFDTVQIDDLPLFNPDNEAAPPPAVARVKAAIRGADGVLFVTPEHNRSIPAALKNAIDWASRPSRTAPSAASSARSSAHRADASRQRWRKATCASSPDASSKQC